MTQMQNSQCEVDEQYKIGKWFTGLIPCWIDAPSTLQAAHNHHGKNIVAIHLKDGGYRCCCVDDKEPTTFSLAENTSLVEGWHNRESSCDEKAEEKARRYDEALERMKSWVRGEHPECFTEAQKAAEFIFPELKESKDEKIKREILELVSIAGNGNQFEEIKDWLEKQGKKIIHNMSNNNDDDIDICDTCKEGLYCSQSNYVKSHCWRRR